MSVTLDHRSAPPVGESRTGGDDGPAAPDGRQVAAEQARAATRARLLKSAKVLFADLGLHRVTTHDIAARAGVAAGTFYNHFPDKGAIFREITSQAVDELNRRLARADTEAHSPSEAVRGQTRALVGFAEEHRNLIRILFSREADALEVEADVLDGLARNIAEERDRAAAEGPAPAPVDTAVWSQAVVGMWARVVIWWAEDPRRAPRETVIETLSRIQLGGTHPG